MRIDDPVFYAEYFQQIHDFMSHSLALHQKLKTGSRGDLERALLTSRADFENASLEIQKLEANLSRLVQRNGELGIASELRWKWRTHTLMTQDCSTQRVVLFFCCWHWWSLFHFCCADQSDRRGMMWWRTHHNRKKVNRLYLF